MESDTPFPNRGRLVAMRREKGNLIRRFSLASIVAALSLAASASPAMASVTVGQTAQSPPVSSNTGDSFDLLQATVVSGNGYVVPANGTLTSWSTYANVSGGLLAMKIYRPSAGTRTWPLPTMALGRSPPAC
jgi:hypothetical protein